MEEQFAVSDGSNDRDYFTIIPNYILNHSTIYDRSLYITLKRIAGEKGTCWMTTRNLAEKAGMSAGQVSKSLKYLLDKGWIQQIGKRDGKTKPTNEYRIVDIWHLNSEYYRKKESSHSEQSQKIVHPVNLESSPSDTKEDPRIKKNPLKIPAAKAASVQKRNPLDNPEPCSLLQFVAWCRKSDQRHIRIIGE